MTLDEAIKELETPGIPFEGPALKVHSTARKIAIEAMKAIKRQRADMFLYEIKVLSGETEK